MESVSVSKGVFAYKGAYKIGQKKKLFESSDYYNEPWHVAYMEAWKTIQEAAENIRSTMIQQVISDLTGFVDTVKNKEIHKFNNEISTAILLIGINVPDHALLFETIVSKLQSLTPHVAVVWSRNCNNIGNIVEDTVFQLLNSIKMDDVAQIRKSQCVMRILKAYYQKYCDQNDPLVIVLPDFESFNPNVLSDFILILSIYTPVMKFVLIFGVATTLHVVHRSLSYDVTSKLVVQVFYTQTQIKSLADLIDGIVFNANTPFKLTGRAFQLLTDVFLFYDFSVDGFLQNYKQCLMQHFYGNNINSLCCQPKDIRTRMSHLSDEDKAEIKKLPSIIKYMKTTYGADYIVANMKDCEFTEMLEELLLAFQRYIYRFLIILKCLHSLSATLPNAPLGKQLRELYTTAVYTNNITESDAYKTCIQLLSFLSKEELLKKLEDVMTIIENSNDTVTNGFKINLVSHMNVIKEASLDVVKEPTEVVTADAKLSRAELKEKLLKMSQKQSRSPYKHAQLDLIKYLDEAIFSIHLINPSEMPANEIFCYRDGNSAKHHIRGSLRAVIHTGLNDPQVYLECDCCRLESEESISRTLPDLSIIYKLHLESRKLINMYDWLQAFRCIVDPPHGGKEENEVDPKIQARFTRAVAELQFLGFIKTSRKKTDHVKRLT